MERVSAEQEQINRQLMELGRAMREDDGPETMRLVFNLAADALGNMARCATALERIQQLLEDRETTNPWTAGGAAAQDRRGGED